MTRQKLIYNKINIEYGEEFGSILLTKYNKDNKSVKESEERLMNQMITKANTYSNVGMQENFRWNNKTEKTDEKQADKNNESKPKAMSSLQSLRKTKCFIHKKGYSIKGDGETKKTVLQHR